MRDRHPGDPTRSFALLSAHGWEMADLISAGVLDTVPGDPPVPISVWRATGPQDPPVSPADLFSGLTARLAAMLLAVYTDPGQTVIDTTHDPALEGVAGSAGRAYLSLDLRTARARSDRLVDSAHLLLMRWPPRIPPPGGGLTADDPGIADAFSTCARLLRIDGHVAVILAPPADTHYQDHAQLVVPAARAADLGYLQHLVVITLRGADLPDSDRSSTTPAWGSGEDSTPAPRQHLDILMFVLRRGSWS